jgi:DNA-binding transcriptional LysR family regulator
LILSASGIIKYISFVEGVGDMLDPKILTFIHVAELKSLTRASELLNLTQPAVTQHIKLLEGQYGVKLIRRKGRQTDLTEEGEVLYKYAVDFEAKASLLERKLKNESALVRKYHIGATLTIGEFVLPVLLGEHKKLHKNIDIIMQVHNTEEITKKLSNGAIDFGVVEGPFDRNRFLFKKLRDDELVLAVSPENKLACKSGVKMDELLNGSLILRERGSGTREIFENKLTELDYNLSDLKVYMEIGSIGAIKSLVEANLGYTVISRTAINRELQAGSLVAVPIDGIKIMREFNLIYSKDSPVEFINSFINFLS